MKTTCRKMSVVQLTFVTAANMLGAGIIMLPTKLAEYFLDYYLTRLFSPGHGFCPMWHVHDKARRYGRLLRIRFRACRTFYG